jgi:hypothetical protein
MLIVLIEIVIHTARIDREVPGKPTMEDISLLQKPTML